MTPQNRMKKLEKILPEELRNSLSAQQTNELKNTIVQCLENINTAKAQLDSNEKYQEIKESLKVLSEGYKEVKKFQTAKIDYCMLLIDDQA